MSEGQEKGTLLELINDSTGYGGIQAILLFFSRVVYCCCARPAQRLRWGLRRRSKSIRKYDFDRRIERSIANIIESLAAFFPVCAAAFYLNADGPINDTAALVYIIARLSFVVVYLANVPYIRTAFWFLGKGAIIALFVTSFTAFRGLG
ncbi:MAG: MAPEG family protein [Pelagimonas sp.]|uniref:MAPEG family protein n=1 Tax=Pelagimonas sp. TaxID=2073170 RepID=UPI003D6ABF13